MLEQAEKQIITQQDIVRALKILRQNCHDHAACKGCAFFIDNQREVENLGTVCALRRRQDPGEWIINEGEEWRALL